MRKRINGYTLIELLVVVAILGTVGFIVTQIFFTVLQSTAKTDLTREVKQNGDYALSVMEKIVRNAIGLDNLVNPCPFTNRNSLQITNPGNPSTTTTFSLSGNQIASTGGMLTNTKVRANDLFFTCTRTSGKPDLIMISFTLTQANVSATRPEEKASINFQTTVSLRNY